MPESLCHLGTQVAVLEIVTDIIGDIVLVAIPLRLFWNLRVDRSSRIRLITVFSMSVLTTIVSLCQNYYQIHNVGNADTDASTVQTFVSLLVCNLNVLVAAVYQWRKGKDLENTPTSDFRSRKNQNRSVGGFTFSDTLPSTPGIVDSNGVLVRQDTLQWPHTPLSAKSAQFDGTRSDPEVGNTGNQNELERVHTRTQPRMVDLGSARHADSESDDGRRPQSKSDHYEMTNFSRR